MKKLLLIIMLLLGSILHAEEDQGAYLGNKCARVLGCLGSCGGHPKIIQIASGEDTDTFQQSVADAKIIYGISNKLNYFIPDNIIRHATGIEMAAVASVGGHPAPVWSSGAKLVAGVGGTMGVYEVVFPGRSFHDQYIRSGNSVHDNRTVFPHVAGHYHFAVKHPVSRIRDLDQIGDTEKLAEYMSEIKLKVNESEYSDWYHRLETLSYLQDLSRGSYYPPSHFEPSKTTEFSTESSEDKVNPLSPTSSVMQALVANLPATTPGWKVNMAQLYEKTVKIIGSYTQTKVMNEGFAVLSQYLHLKHAPADWRTSADAAEFAQINSGVVFPKLNNPYWLGVEAWRIHYAQFKNKMASLNLSDLDLDARFVTEIVDPILESGYNDYTFVRATFNEKWVEKHKLFLYKSEIQGHEEVKIVVTQDPQRIVNSFSQMFNKDIHFARIELVNLNENRTGTVLLRHTPAYGIPLKLSSMAPALYQVARFMKAPIKLETIWTAMWFQSKGNSKASPQETGPMSVQVDASGKVQLNLFSEKIPPEVQKSLRDFFQSSVDEFKKDLTLSYGSQPLPLDVASMKAGSDHEAPITGVDSSLLGHMPTTTPAILEFIKMRDRRFLIAAKAAIRGETKNAFSASGVVVKVLPDTPMLENDTRIIGVRKSFRQNNLGPASMMTHFGGTMAQTIPDEDMDISAGDKLPGDILDRKPAGGGGGSGPGDGNGDADKESGKGASGGEADPQMEEIPQGLYGKMLAEDIEIRNLRRTSQKDIDTKSFIKEGDVRRASNDVNWPKTSASAYEMGLVMQKRENMKLPEGQKKKRTNLELIRFGYKFLPQNQYTSPSLDIQFEPSYSVVLMVLADVSGSMSKEHKEAMRRAIYNEVAALEAAHKKVTVRYYHYSQGAKEVSVKEFYTKSEGSSTDTAAGITLVASDLEKDHPRDKINRVVSIFSDGDDSTPDASAALGAALAEKVDFLTYANIDPEGKKVGPLSESFEALSKRSPDKVGYANISADPATVYRAIKNWFGKRN